MAHRDSTGALVDFNRTHRFRHTVATGLLNSGVPLHVLQRYLGHIHADHDHDLRADPAVHRRSRVPAPQEDHRRRARDLEVDPRDLYDLIELDKRTDRVLPNGYCLLPPRQVCGHGNACLTCDKFTTDATYLPEQQTSSRAPSIAHRPDAPRLARTGERMARSTCGSADAAERDALERIILTLKQHRTRR